MMKNGLEGMLEIVQEGMNKGPFNGNVTGGGYQIPIFAREKNVDPPPKLRGKKRRPLPQDLVPPPPVTFPLNGP